MLPEMTPDDLVELLFSFAAQECPSRVRSRTGLGSHNIRTSFNLLRACLTSSMAKLPAVRLGGRGPDVNWKPVILDKGRVVKKLKNAGGFIGQPSVGIKTWVMIGIELTREEMPRAQTGKCFVVLIPQSKGVDIPGGHPPIAGSPESGMDGRPSFVQLS